jgi:hypothetical protein
MKKHTQSIAQGLTIAGLIVWIMLLFSSCTTSRRSNYQDHLRSTPSQNWVRHDNGGCGWHN